MAIDIFSDEVCDGMIMCENFTKSVVIYDDNRHIPEQFFQP